MKKNEILSKTQSALADRIASLKPSPYEPNEKTAQEMIPFDQEETDDKWKDLLAKYLKTATTFEIHCWNEETEWLEVAMQYGVLKENNWQYGKIIVGNITPAFASMLLNMPKPTDTETYNKMTPFFNIFFDNCFSSSHYGTEVYYNVY